MKKVIFLLFPFIVTTSIYNFSITDQNGNTISLENFKGKKILFVNSASGSPYVRQLASLDTLYEKYKDSLEVIVIPSNTFHSEPKSNAAIKDFIQETYHVHYLISEKTDVAGGSQSSLYKWLTHYTENGMMDNNINEDFYKFLIDQQGRLVGIFAPSVDPMSDEMQSAIKN
ncbi:MAG: redoxin family protein [Bacteroidota bacterium]|nr:redoxin family protein [Bacteroidota bacterium]